MIFNLSYCGIALYCNFGITKRLNKNHDYELINNLKDGDKFFFDANENIDYDKITNILKNKNIKLYFFINVEPLIEENNLYKLLDYSYKIYLQNNIFNHPKIHSLPIGIRDCETILPNHYGFNHNFLFNERNNYVNKEILCLLCFTIDNHNERINCYNYFNDKKYVTNINLLNFEKQPSIHCGKVPVWINYEFTHKSIYILCPRGCGIDTHRFYEAIYLNSIPIVLKTNTSFDKIFNIFPCLVIDKWEDINEKFLLDNIENCINKLNIFNNKYPNFLTDIDSILEIL